MEQGSTIAIVKNSQKDIRDGVRWEENMKKKCALQGGASGPPFAEACLLAPLSNDRFLINVLTGRDYLSTSWLKSLFFVDFHRFSSKVFVESKK